MLLGQYLNSHRIFNGQAKALIGLRALCPGWSKALLVAHTTLLEISCCGSFHSGLVHFSCISVWHHFIRFSPKTVLMQTEGFNIQGENNTGSRQNRYRDQYSNNIQIYLECEGERAKFVLRITVWQAVIPKAQNFVSHFHTNVIFFSSSPLNSAFLFPKSSQRFLNMWSSNITWWRHTDIKWAVGWDFQQCGMCDQQSLRSASTYARSDQSLC